MEIRGYLLVKKGDNYANNLQKDYKGIDRDALSAYIPDNEIEENPAIRKMNTILKEKQNAALMYLDFLDDENAFNNVEDAVVVYNLLEDKDDYELIEVRRYEMMFSQDFLGYDIGYWGGDHFSIIANTLLVPRRDFYPEQDFDLILAFEKLLNKNLLFSDIKDAERYLKFYRGKTWAETDSPSEFEESEFYIIQVNDCNKFLK